MKIRLNYFLFSMFCLLFLPLVTFAKCSDSRMAELNKIASNVKISYGYDVSSDSIEYDVYIANLTNDVYVLDSYDNIFSGTNDIIKHYSHDEEIMFFPGDTISFKIYSNDINCKDEILTNKYITLLNYNHYSLSQECINNPKFKYCNLWKNPAGIDQELFDSELQAYLNNKKNVKNIEDSENVYNIFFDNVIFMAILFFIICLFIFFIRRVRKK